MYPEEHYRAQFFNVIEYEDGSCSGDLRIFLRNDLYGNGNDINFEGRGEILSRAGEQVGFDLGLTYKTSQTQSGDLYHQWWPGRR